MYSLKNKALKKQAKILIIDDEIAICEVLSASLEDEGYTVHAVNDGLRGLKAVSELKPDVVLLDIWMPGELDGLEVLSRAKNLASAQFIVMSGHGTIETAVKATKLGAWDFVEKPLSMDRVSVLIGNILNYQAEMGEKAMLLNYLRQSFAIVGESESVVVLKQMISRVAPASSWVLVTGENGTGRELVAKNIHYLSSRAGRPFVEVNCTAIPEELIESELFGYEQGAFSGVDKSKGKFDHADGGTLFLDEIGDINLEVQAKILGILQRKGFQRVGGHQTIEVEVRVIAASNRDLRVEISKGRFREDLYHRLNMIPLCVPSLRERKSDIPILVSHFGEQFSRQGGYQKKIFSTKALEALKNYDWPGNVRELRNFVERVYILTPGECVEVHDLSFAGLPYENSSAVSFDEGLTFREARAVFERDFLMRKISGNNGNISKTAELIGLERSYLHRKIKLYGIEV